MYVAITVFESIGLDISIEKYISGEYHKEKPIEEAIGEVVEEIMMARKLRLETKE